MSRRPLRDVDTADAAGLLRFRVMVVIPGTIMLLMLQTMLWGPGNVALRLPLTGGLLWVLAGSMWRLIHRGSETLINGLLAGGGDAPTPQYSEVEALVIQGRHAEALAMYRAIADETADAEVRLRIGDLLLHQLRDPAAAEAAYRSAREASPTPAQASRIINSLIDLHREQGNREGLKQELSRFARLHAGTPAGEQAREAVRRMTREDQATGGPTDPPPSPRSAP